LALSAFSALRLVMLDISSREAPVSSSEAACSLAPSASDWLALEIWAEAIRSPIAGLLNLANGGRQRSHAPFSKAWKAAPISLPLAFLALRAVKSGRDGV
jgi:hypothetical protein